MNVEVVFPADVITLKEKKSYIMKLRKESEKEKQRIVEHQKKLEDLKQKLLVAEKTYGEMEILRKEFSEGIANKIASDKTFASIVLESYRSTPSARKNVTELLHSIIHGETKATVIEKTEIKKDVEVKSKESKIESESEEKYNQIFEIPQDCLVSVKDEFRLCLRTDKGIELNKVYMYEGKRIRFTRTSRNADGTINAWDKTLDSGEKCKVSYYTFEIVE